MVIGLIAHHKGGWSSVNHRHACKPAVEALPLSTNKVSATPGARPLSKPGGKPYSHPARPAPATGPGPAAGHAGRRLARQHDLLQRVAMTVVLHQHTALHAPQIALAIEDGRARLVSNNLKTVSHD
jgi:hypothetical protein